MTKLKSPPVEDFYAELTPGLRSLAIRGKVRSYAKKTVIINEGDDGDSLFVILKGSVKAYAMDASGREITYGIISSCDYFGEMSLDGGPRSASIMSLEPSICAVLTRRDVAEHLSDEPEFALQLVVKVIQRARAATEVARSMALLDVYSRMAAVLQENLTPAHYTSLPKRKSQTEQPALLEPHVLECTHLDVASRVGASREAISRILKQLERSGHVILSSKRITLLKKLPAQI
jgi:CRP/FNR family transcriptional regulator, cyclic AMP receptor protein